MKAALFDSTTIDVSAKNYVFRANGQTLKFDGFLKVYPMKIIEATLPLLKRAETLTLIKLTPLQHFTQPPGRFSEATLIKALEIEGIGRPSTYAPIISTIQERNYVEKDDEFDFKIFLSRDDADLTVEGKAKISRVATEGIAIYFTYLSKDSQEKLLDLIDELRPTQRRPDYY